MSETVSRRRLDFLIGGFYFLFFLMDVEMVVFVCVCMPGAWIFPSRTEREEKKEMKKIYPLMDDFLSFFSLFLFSLNVGMLIDD
jgi:hypothetical protein